MEMNPRNWRWNQEIGKKCAEMSYNPHGEGFARNFAKTLAHMYYRFKCVYSLAAIRIHIVRSHAHSLNETRFIS